MQQPPENVTIESTLKSLDTEEIIDIYFYRPIGFRWALLCRSLGITPNMVTIASIFIGSAAGLFFYPKNLQINIIGMLLLMLANSFDSADGQLARLTNTRSRLGRILDGLAGIFWFGVIHIALPMRLQNDGWPVWIWILSIASLLAHSLQAQQADYYRNIHLFFIKGESGSEQDNSAELNASLARLSWKKDFGKKLWMTFYRNYTRQQELFSPNLQKFMAQVRHRYKSGIPAWLVAEFRVMHKPLMKYTNILTFNTRTLFLFFCLFINKVWLYFLFDLIVLNAILVYMIVQQEKISRHFYNKLIANPAD